MLEELHNCDVSRNFLKVFPLKRYGYIFESRLNAKDGWERKVVCSVLKDGTERYVSTTFPNEEGYWKFLEVSSILKKYGMLHPEIFRVYETERTAICHYTGEFLPPLLLGEEAYSAIDAVLGYLALLNSMFSKEEMFEIPHSVRSFFELSDQFPQLLSLISETKNILPELRERGICFSYGSGIKDPDIKNFRILREDGEFQALTTDYDCWSERVNCFWAIGYFYASFRWLAKISPEASRKCSEYILRTMNVDDQRDEFMFWLGVLSSYCWYKKVIKKAIIEDRMDEFQDKSEIIKELNKKVSHLASRLIEIKGSRPVDGKSSRPVDEMEEKGNANWNGLYLSTD